MDEAVYSVSGLVGEVRSLLEDGYRQIRVKGEISDLATPPSGHIYFNLKEEDAVIRCVLFRGRNQQGDAPRVGMQALLYGQVTVYAPRGNLQLKVAQLEDIGEGALRREFDRLKKALAAEGLFDARHKQPLPPYPRAIGVISSASGAALQDVRVTLARRYPLARLVVYPTLVQGAEAADTIITMFDIANRRREVDLLILARGGGSLEDLQPFNHEGVARAIFACGLPVVSAVGHEIDHTVADLVADLRAATPTAAAQAVSPELAQLRERIRREREALGKIAQRIIDTLSQKLDYADARTRSAHPLQRIQSAEHSHNDLTGRLERLMDAAIGGRAQRAAQLDAALRYCSPERALARNREQFAGVRGRLRAAVAAGLDAANRRAERLTEQLALLSPTHTLARGYAIIQDDERWVVRDAAETKTGQRLSAQVARGKFRCVVE